MPRAIFGNLHAPDPVEPEPPIQLSPEAPHRMRRAEDTEELRIREAVWQHFASDLGCDDSVRPSLIAALDEYKRELGLLAIKRLGMGGCR